MAGGETAGSPVHLNRVRPAVGGQQNQQAGEQTTQQAPMSSGSESHEERSMGRSSQKVNLKRATTGLPAF